MDESLRERVPTRVLPGRERDRHRLASWSWPAVGWASGFIGASVVAVFFLAIDLVAGRPLWTPAALGSALFLGQRLLPAAHPPLVLVVGYTAVHLGVFAGLGLIAATALSVRPRPRRLANRLTIGVGLLAASELSFAAFAWLFAPTLMGDLGAWRITAANALAAAAMTAFLGRMAAHLEPDAANP
ncbi:MAG TPA: hypothetical protein VMS55_04785 [Myxococcota bacterium]|nr:hypothetical protein [Myxococcota bacterium]